MQPDKNYKRDLVDIMRRIDDGQISTGSELLEALEQMAMKHQSSTLNTIVHSIISIIAPLLDANDSATPPPRLG